MAQVSLKYNICSSYNIYKDVTLQDKVIYLFFVFFFLIQSWFLSWMLPHVYGIFWLRQL